MASMVESSIAVDKVVIGSPCRAVESGRVIVRLSSDPCVRVAWVHSYLYCVVHDILNVHIVRPKEAFPHLTTPRIVDIDRRTVLGKAISYSTCPS
eukprot:1551436-Amphidinium_carterae.2